VAKSAVYQAALEGIQFYNEADDHGVTAQQALAADVAAARHAGLATSAADRGTVAYWLYGDGLADSGGRDGAVDRDEVSFSAR